MRDKTEPLEFTEHTSTTKSIPMVLTKSQVDQIMNLSEGGDLRPRCRLVYILNKQLYEAGVLV